MPLTRARISPIRASHFFRKRAECLILQSRTSMTANGARLTFLTIGRWDSISKTSLNSTAMVKPLGRDYPATSIGWYRRVFDVPASDAGRRIWIEFDGVFRDSIAVLNGIYLGRHGSGYTPFRYDVSDLVNYGGKNVLVVRVGATAGEGWWYEGAGIYRHVW